ncbi:MAG: 4-alpha-glucanotransferase [Bacteroidota bacterium]|nr:4-alpha-glucanotransferase [Bacteroidota bacterium]
MKLHFYLRFNTKPGQALYVTGNIPELGLEHTRKPAAYLRMQYMSPEFWQLSIDLMNRPHNPIQYHYALKMEDGDMISEWDNDREIPISQKTATEIQTIDTWNYTGEYENAFYTAPFFNTLMPGRPKKSNTRIPKQVTHLFKVKAPLLAANQCLCLSGSGEGLEDWSTEDPILLKKEGNWWTAAVYLPREFLPVSYKYGVYDLKHKQFLHFENGANRSLPGDAQDQKLTMVHDGFVHLANDTWKGAGLSIPVFSLRSKQSFGCGEFTDLKLLVDWAAKTGLKLIQILPVNDTSATGTWLDSYPYAAISAFALHPVYLNLEETAGKKYDSHLKTFRKKQRQLNALPDLDYETVISNKIAILKKLYEHQQKELQADPEFLKFFEVNKFWLTPYAAFCYLRDINGTVDFTKWKTYGKYNKLSIDRLTAPQSKQYDQIALHYFIQYHLHRQLSSAADYAHKKGIVIKGDIPIGIYRYSCDAWMSPELYQLDQQAGAPPDSFALKGQNWGFPTYNWAQMEKDDFQWWKNRFEQMAIYFDAFRIDHILGFFRIWSIPLTETEGVMGRFDPAIPVHRIEFDQRNIWFDTDRYTRPFINDAVLWEHFSQDTEKAKSVFFEEIANGNYRIRDFVNTQQKTEAYFADKTEDPFDIKSRAALLSLISNVILFEVDGSGGKEFHFRIMMDTTSSFRYLDWNLQQQLKELYVNYFFRRQDAFWKKVAMEKLPALKRSTNMLVCGEDLGMVPDCVPDVMKQLGILSLEIQRMPKDQSRDFFHPADAPYLSVVTPSTHDMSTIRGWWEENRGLTQKFFNNELGQWGEAPLFCDAWINKAVVNQNLHSPAMWSIFQLQDLMGMDENIRRENPNDERINVPAIAKYYWKYRMHLFLEDLLKEKDFNEQLKEMLKASGRLSDDK